MLLAIDSGNTNLVVALFADETLCGTWRLETNPRRTVDELAVWILQFIALKGFCAGDVDAVAIANVVPEVMRSLNHLARDYFNCEPLIVGSPDLDIGVEAHIDRPEEVGADRLVNALAAHKLYVAPLIVIDFGTATTFDVVDGEGNYCGGVICPGINLSIQALRMAAAKLPGIDICHPDWVIGQTTIQAMQSGVFWGYIGLIEGIENRIRSEMAQKFSLTPETIKVVATGGLASLFAEATHHIQHVDGNLTLKGLAYIYARNRGSII